MKIKVLRQVKENEMNPNGFYTKDLDKKLREHIELYNQTKSCFISEWRESTNSEQDFYTNLQFVIGTVLDFDSDYVTLNINDKYIFLNDIIDNTDSYRVLISYLGESDSITNNRNLENRVYTVSRILKIELKKID